MFTSFTLAQNEIVEEDDVREGEQKAVKGTCRQKGFRGAVRMGLG